MVMFDLALLVSAFLCSLVAGFLFAYAVVVMPGIKQLSDKQFIQSFQVTDSIIQNNSPIFVVVWLGSVVAVIASAILGAGQLPGLDLLLLGVATLCYLLGVQLATIVVHLPLNNQLQKVVIDSLSDRELHAARLAFEPRWNRSNRVRTWMASGVSLLFIILLYRQ